MDFAEVTRQSCQAVTEILDGAKVKEGSIFVIGCSSSEILGDQIGTATSMEAAEAVYDGIIPVLRERGILPGFCWSPAFGHHVIVVHSTPSGWAW